MKKILLTGGVGYIGSHTVVELASCGFDVFVLDNLVNSKISVIESLGVITNQKISFFEGDVRDQELIYRILVENNIDGVIHFAGLKSVEESFIKPQDYYDINLVGTINLARAMARAGVGVLVFSSSATIYGNPEYLPIDENHKICPLSPYGTTKACAETFLSELCRSEPEFWSVRVLRYFNPVGAHESALIGESPLQKPTNLFPIVIKCLEDKGNIFVVNGDDYSTKDGTAVRDFIHVCDLAHAHISAISHCTGVSGFDAFNIGTGVGLSINEVLSVFQEVAARPITVKVGPRRSGDVEICIADPSKAESILGWKASLNIWEMCESSWVFSKDNW